MRIVLNSELRPPRMWLVSFLAGQLTLLVVQAFKVLKGKKKRFKYAFGLF